MNRYLKNLNRIEFVVTMACTGRCIHCSQGEHSKTGCIDKDKAAQAVHRIADEYNIESVMTFGGEPLLYNEVVCEIHNAARQKNIKKRQLITNGYFSKDENKIKEITSRLIESGVNEILLSVDAFHQRTIPLEYVKMFAKSVCEYDISFKLHPAWLVSEQHNNEYNIKTREILGQFEGMNIEISQGNVIFPSGNALKYLSEYFDSPKKYKNPYKENPRDVRAICIGADGDIFGESIYEKDISDILSGYKPKSIFHLKG